MINLGKGRVRKIIKDSFLSSTVRGGLTPAIRRLQIGSVDTVVDLGAHYGIVSLLARFLHPDARIVAVEPYWPNYVVLRENTKGLEIERHQFAIGKTGKAYLDPTAGTMSMSKTYQTAETDGAMVQSFSLPYFVGLREINLEKLYLKIDIEGAEHHFLKDKQAIRILRRCVGIDFDAHQTKEAGRAHRYRKWLEKHFTKTHVIRHSGRGTRHSYSVLLRRDVEKIYPPLDLS